MFESLDEQIRKDDDRVSSSQQRLIRWALYALVGVVVLGGLILGVRFMS
jgi:hypothetical protein